MRPIIPYTFTQEKDKGLLKNYFFVLKNITLAYDTEKGIADVVVPAQNPTISPISPSEQFTLSPPSTFHHQTRDGTKALFCYV